MEIMVQCLHVCPAEWCILKLQTAWALIASYWHWENSLGKEGMSGWSILIMEPILLRQTWKGKERKASKEIIQWEESYQNQLGLLGDKILLWQAIWEDFGSAKFCSAWNILNLLLRTHRESLHDESLITSLVEAEEILNSRSITYESISDVNSYVPLSTLRLLTMNTNVCGGATTRNFSGRSILLKRMKICPTSLWWVWDKWRKEVHATLQARKKWNHVKRNFEVGDIILVCNNISRNAWPTTQILKTFGDKEGLLCNVQLVIGKNLQTARRYQYLSNL